MNIEPGTRVRFTDEKFPAHVGEIGVYLGMAAMYYLIHWELEEAGWNDLHLEGEFEVIDE